MRNPSGRIILGKLGEAILYSEILKKGFNCYILGSQNINTLADIIVEGNITLEVKTAIYSRNCKRSTYSYAKEGVDKAYSSGWQFGALKRSRSNYYVFVLLEENLDLYKFLVFPKDTIKRDQFFYLRPSAGDFKGGKGRARVETVIDPKYQGLNLIFERLNGLKSNA